MKNAASSSKNMVRFTSLFLALALLASGISGSTKSVRFSQGAQQNGSGRRVAPLPPQTGPPAANLPNLDELRGRQNSRPVQAPHPITSTMRSRHKPAPASPGRTLVQSMPAKSNDTHYASAKVIDQSRA